MREVAGPVLHRLALEVPPRQRLDVRRLVGPQRLDLLGRQGPPVDARIFDRPGERRSRPRPHVPQPEHGDVVLDIQQVHVLRLVRRVRLAVAVDADVVAFVHDRDLDQRVGPGGLGGVGVLVRLRAAEEIAAGHPLAARPLAEHDRVELVAALDRQHAAALLVQVRRRDPRDQRLVSAGRFLRDLGAVRGKGPEQHHGGRQDCRPKLWEAGDRPRSVLA